MVEKGRDAQGGEGGGGGWLREWGEEQKEERKRRKRRKWRKRRKRRKSRRRSRRRSRKRGGGGVDGQGNQEGKNEHQLNQEETTAKGTRVKRKFDNLEEMAETRKGRRKRRTRREGWEEEGVRRGGSGKKNSSQRRQKVAGRGRRQNLIRSLLACRKLPTDGWEDNTIQMFLHDIASMDSNNFLGAVGVGEREARCASRLVYQRHFGLCHGIGRSGNVTEEQPKAAGSSLISKLCNLLVAHAMEIAGLKDLGPVSVLPVATGMTLMLVLMALRQRRPATARFVLWPRIDQKTCVKAVLLAGLDLVVIPNRLEGDQLRTDTAALFREVEDRGADSILCVVSTTSCFAARAADRVQEIAIFCQEKGIPHVINNAYGVQSAAICKSISRAWRKGRVDGIVQSTDKNFLVPVGGAVVAASKMNPSLVADVNEAYAGRASMTPLLDVLITLLSLGAKGWQRVLRDREEIYPYLRQKLQVFAQSQGERLLQTPDNAISLAITLSTLEAAGEPCKEDSTAEGKPGCSTETKQTSSTATKPPCPVDDTEAKQSSSTETRQLSSSAETKLLPQADDTTATQISRCVHENAHPEHTHQERTRQENAHHENGQARVPSLTMNRAAEEEAGHWMSSSGHRGDTTGMGQATSSHSHFSEALHTEKADARQCLSSLEEQTSCSQWEHFETESRRMAAAANLSDTSSVTVTEKKGGGGSTVGAVLPRSGGDVMGREVVKGTTDVDRGERTQWRSSDNFHQTAAACSNGDQTDHGSAGDLPPLINEFACDEEIDCGRIDGCDADSSADHYPQSKSTRHRGCNLLSDSLHLSHRLGGRDDDDDDNDDDDDDDSRSRGGSCHGGSPSRSQITVGIPTTAICSACDKKGTVDKPASFLLQWSDEGSHSHNHDRDGDGKGDGGDSRVDDGDDGNEKSSVYHDQAENERTSMVGVGQLEGKGVDSAECPIGESGKSDEKLRRRNLTAFGSMLFLRHISGCRVIARGECKSVGGIEFKGYGASADNYPYSYMTAAAALGLTHADVDAFIAKLGRCFAEFRQKSKKERVAGSKN
ncbi:hypothetical protein CBR_g3762 [Chara braunii]|uniref:O-phosphoseryl-tRNA(Sec) selenium transferase n=1 Tax=Chara braunii TaxID=69332 RepID=A0A388KG71_CHABU|nr:hypothetical protein CBR_g3762 [Chara braunii]|eukprot:GBG69064.1 hypothetical protein CBR_g3762 [Chara braunii]